MTEHRIVDVTVRVWVAFENDSTADEVISNCNYGFAIEPDPGKETPRINKTDLREVLEIADFDPETGVRIN